MDYRFENLNAMRVIGVKRTFNNGKDMQQGIPEFWQEVNDKGITEKLVEMSNGTLTGVLGVVISYSTGEMDYFIGVPSEEKMNDYVMYSEFHLNPHQYVVFNVVGRVPESIKEAMPHIYQDILPNVDFETINAPLFEHYLPGNTQDVEYITEIYIPIK